MPVDWIQILSAKPQVFAHQLGLFLLAIGAMALLYVLWRLLGRGFKYWRQTRASARAAAAVRRQMGGPGAARRPGAPSRGTGAARNRDGAATPDIDTPPEDTVFPDSKFASVAGFKIRYVQRGSASKPDLVLIHGFSAYIYSWRHILNELAEDFHVTALDLPGFGRSDKLPKEKYGLDEQTDRILQFLDFLKIKKFNLAGHSMGGAIAAWMAKTHPERVRQVALLAPAVNQNVVWFNPRHWSWALPLIKRNLVTPALVRRIYRQVSAVEAPADLDDVIRHYYSPYQGDANSLVTSYGHLHLLRDTRLKNGLDEIQCPTLVIYGSKDPVVRKAGLDLFLKRNPHATVLYDPNAGHMLAEENPRFIIENLRQFFARKT